jgi:transposase
MTPPDEALLAEVAARYGVGVAPGAQVRRVPRGVSGLPAMQWSERARQVVTGLTRAEVRAAGRTAFLRARQTGRQARLARLRELHAQGLTVVEMAVATGVSEVTIYDDLRDLRLPPHRPPPDPALGPARRERLAAIARMLDEGMLQKDIARNLGVARQAVGRDMAILGRARSRATPEALAERRVRVRDLRAKGLTLRAIARTLRLSKAAVEAALRAAPGDGGQEGGE